jgi:hypothetical protein
MGFKMTICRMGTMPLSFFYAKRNFQDIPRPWRPQAAPNGRIVKWGGQKP